MISEFQGEYRWLSNFVGGVEQKYQAAKCLDAKERDLVLCLPPGEAKRAGRRVKIRPNWDEIKLSMMENLVREKFQREPFRSKLLGTGDQEIQEGNWWKDSFWGVDLRTGKGENHLGKIIMKIRQELRDGKK